jgi:hypothetical protein
MSLKDLETIPVEILQDFRKTGESMALGDDLKQYILQLDRAVEIRTQEHEHNIMRGAKRLRESFPEISLSTAKNRIYDAINYFHLNSTVKAEAWSNYYADRMEDLARLSIAANNITEARRCIERSKEFRLEASNLAIDPNEIKPHTFLISPEVNPSLLGLEEFNLGQLWTNTEKFIRDLPIDQRDKQTALSDAALALNRTEDIDYEDVNEEEDE